MANPAVKLNSVSFAYDTGKRALKSVSMQVAHEAKVALIGQTGSGKSTLSRLVCALEVPDSGTVTVEGIDTSSKKNRRQLHGRIGYVMQHPERQLFAETVAADVAYGPRNMGLTADEVERRVSEALATVHLTGLEHVSPFELSGGQQRLCAIAGVLAMSPSTLVLDEPMAGLDPARRNELRDILERIHAQGTTIIQITHSMDEAARADTVFVLDEGRIRMSGAPAEVFRVDVREELTGAGLGIPHALEWALLLEEAGTPNLGNPLTFEALVDAILSHLDSSRDEVV